LNPPILKIFSDYICPFCYVLLPKINRLQQELSIEVAWYPVLSHPETPEEGLPLVELIGDRRLLEDAVRSAKALGEQEGIDLVIPDRVSSSKMAIWMSECARQHGNFEAYHRRVYQAYFEEGRDIGDDETIPDIIRSLQIPREDVLAFGRNRQRYGKIMARRVLECRKREVTKVPTLILDDLKIEGSWPYPLLFKTVKSALEGS
jgi:predicted DsbA family dithiol-disulfide isomerase